MAFFENELAPFQPSKTMGSSPWVPIFPGHFLGSDPRNLRLSQGFRQGNLQLPHLRRHRRGAAWKNFLPPSAQI